MNESEIDKFVAGLPGEDKTVRDIFDENTPKEPVVAPEKEEDDNSSLKNRRERRLEDKLRRSEEMQIALNERVKILSEQQNYIRETAGEIDPRLVKAFGTTDEGKELTKIMTEVLKDNAEQAKEQALAEFESRQQAVHDEQASEESFIDTQLEAIEDTYNIDLTSNAPAAKKARNEFLGLIEKLSPKDESGSIKEYADFESTFEIYKESRAKPEPSRSKELAARSMQGSAPGTAGSAPTGPMTFKRAEQEINRLFGN